MAKKNNTTSAALTTKRSSAADAAIVLAALEEEARPLIRSLSRIEITDAASYAKASDKMKEVKQLVKMATDREKSLTDPLTQVIKDIRSLFAPFKTLVSGIETKIKSGMLTFVQEQDRKSAQIEQDLESGKIKKLSTAVKKQAELEVSASSSQVRLVWTAIEVDASQTPREYLVPDMVKIKEALKAGKKVKGWSWEQVKNIAI